MPKDYDFPTIKTFRKKVTLPSMSKWRISADDCLVSGVVLTMVKYKGVLCNGSSSCKERDTFVTKQGFMIIYASDDKGYVVDIPEAVKVTTCTTTLRARDGGEKTATMKRTEIEVKLRHGSVMLSANGKEALPWVEAINRLASPCSKDTKAENRLSCQLDTLPHVKRESVNLDYSIISDNSIAIPSPLMGVKRRANKQESGGKQEETARLSITPTPQRRLSPLLAKKIVPVVAKKSLVKQAEVEKPQETEEAPDGEVLEKNGERKTSAPAEVGEQ